MIKKISADWIYPISSEPIKNGIIVADTQTGEILELHTDPQRYDSSEIERHQGLICPNFINTHCHLELSHMRGVAQTGTGLLDFIGQVVSKRNMPQEVIDQAIAQADAEMYAAGIAAVGDISNQTDTFATKSSSKIRYYNFIECFDFWQPALTQPEFDKYKAVFDACHVGSKDRKALVPHAPYSVSPALFAKINQAQSTEPLTVSVHNQETPAENQLFLNKQSDFVAMWQRFGFHYDELQDLGKTSIFYLLQQLRPQDRNLFVHNTLTTAAEIQAAQQVLPRCYFATCPNANLYIENRLPNYRAFIETNALLTIGTDSLTSNWNLSVLEELKTIQKYQSFVDTGLLLRWATYNGALALGMEADLGSIEVGKRCGLNLLNVGQDLRLSDSVQVKRLI